MRCLSAFYVCTVLPVDVVIVSRSSSSFRSSTPPFSSNLEGEGAPAARPRAFGCAPAVRARDGFALDLGDSRFASVYSSSDYAIDPTHPKFRRTLGSESLLAETQRRHVSGEGVKLVTLTAMKFGLILFGTATIFSVLKIAFGG